MSDIRRIECSRAGVEKFLQDLIEEASDENLARIVDFVTDNVTGEAPCDVCAYVGEGCSGCSCEEGVLRFIEQGG